jgi:drug/metabolite transporter (DMT)-like permease
MGVGDAVFYGTTWMFMFFSWNSAKRYEIWKALIFGTIAWCALFLPRLLLWPNQQQENTEWWWLILGALTFIGWPALIFLYKTKKRQSGDK